MSGWPWSDWQGSSQSWSEGWDWSSHGWSSHDWSSHDWQNSQGQSSWPERWEEEMEEVEVEEEKEMAQHWKTGASSAHSLAKQKNNKGRPSGTGTVSNVRRELYRKRSEAKRLAREAAEEEERKQKKAEDEAAAAARAAEEEKRKAAEDEAAAAARAAEEEKRKAAEDEAAAAARAAEEEKKKKAAEEAAKPPTKQEIPEETLVKRDENFTLAERVEKKSSKTETGKDKMALDERDEKEKAQALEDRVAKQEVLQECLLGGAKVYPITTSREQHQWNERNTPAGKPYAYRFLSHAVQHFLKEENQTSRG
eukprot:s2046_g6.t1